MRCKILGAGVSGLSCAIKFLKADIGVEILSKSRSPNTVSDTAAAVWYPFLVEPVEKTDKWSVETYFELIRLMENFPEAGITMRKGREYLREIRPPPGWSKDIKHFRILEDNEIPNEYIFGWEFEVPVIEMQKYMPWMESRVFSMGGTIEKLSFDDLGDVEGDIVINCTGLGAREICNDNELVPVRGQILYLDQDPIIGHFDQQKETLAYTIPRSDVTVLGGTAQMGDYTETPREEDNEQILRKCELMWPDLDREKIIGVGVGLRPSRSELRLEYENVNDKHVIHNYGHGGAGVTLSWGCATEVMRLLQLHMPS
tara:strand:+ start:689 stop:1630 length:942 start_codon:yes stop_codon:yes gene_type:complete